MPDEILSGVEEQESQEAAAPEEEQDIFGLDSGDESGETSEADAEPVNEENAEQEGFEDQSTEKAFAARLAKEREKITRETEERVKKEYEGKYQQQTQQQTQQPQGNQPPPLSKEQLESLADGLGMTNEAAWAVYRQQWLLDRQDEKIIKQEEYMRRIEQGASKTEALKSLEQRHKKNPYLPEPDEKVLGEIRKDYKARTGFDLPWDDAYDKLVARETESGNISRRAEQETIGKITARNKATIQAGKGGQAKKPSIDEMPSDEFNKLVEEAKMGKYKKS